MSAASIRDSRPSHVDFPAQMKKHKLAGFLTDSTNQQLPDRSPADFDGRRHGRIEHELPDDIEIKGQQRRGKDVIRQPDAVGFVG